jgi:hypothetical protein
MRPALYKPGGKSGKKTTGIQGGLKGFFIGFARHKKTQPVNRTGGIAPSFLHLPWEKHHQ